jgi:hypothetical protein
VVDEMVTRELEFRGINLSDLRSYFEALGGQLLTEGFPYVYEGESWRGELLSEEELSFTSVFKVNSVKIRFTAETDSVLEDLIKNYRLKTFRVGG